MKRAKKTHWLRTTLLVLIACVVLGTCISAVRFLTDPNILTYASYRIQLTFDGAASSIAPNGCQFNIKDVFTEEVIETALKASGFDDKYTAGQILDQLSIEGDYPADINQQMMNYESILDFNANREVALTNFHPTLFTVKLYNEFDKSISKADLENLLHNITDTAKAYFNKIYSVSVENDEFMFDLSEYDYSHQATILSRSIEQTLNYANSLYEKAPSFTHNGYSFDDIIIRLENLINNEIDSLNANIAISALSKNNDRLLLQYRYDLENLAIELKNKTECLTKLDSLNASYQKNEILYLSSADSWTKIDGNSSETYDLLVKERKNMADDITDIKSKIEKYTLLEGDLVGMQDASQDQDGVAGNAEAQSQAEADVTIEPTIQDASFLEDDIKYISENHQAIKDDFAVLISAYNAQTINDATVQVIPDRYYTRDLISYSFLHSAFKTVAPLCALGFMVCLVLIIISRKKEQNTVS